MPARAANVALARQVVAGLLDAHEVSAALCADVKIAVTEACTNVVVHAYPNGDGSLETLMTIVDGHLIVSVRDRGVEFNPLPIDSGVAPLGFGLALIASLADEFGIRSGPSGTEVQMMFTLDGAQLENTARAFADATQLVDTAPLSPDEINLTLEPGAPLAGVLGRVVSLLAARADFSIDRLSDAQLVSDALATHAPRRAVNGHVRVGVSENEGGFELRIGPLHAHGGRALVADTALPGVGSLLERLSDEVTFEPSVDGADPDAEMLRLRISRAG